MTERGVIFKDDYVSTPNKSWFDMSFDYLFSMNFGELVPSTCMECMPADIIHAKSDSFIRLAPLVAPTFGKCNFFSYHFYVRNQSIWKSWKSFITDGDQRESWQQATEFIPPEMPYLNVHSVNSLLHSIPYELEHSKVNANRVWTSGLEPSIAFDTVTARFNLENLSCPALYIYRADGVTSCMLIKDVSLVGNVIYADNQGVVIPFLWNKYETALTSDFVKQYGLSSDKYNVFSNGSLFDYLGVDLSALYKDMEDWIFDAFDKIQTTIGQNDNYIHLEQPHSGFVPDSWSFHDYDGKLNCAPFDYNPEFLAQHYIFGIGYVENSQYVFYSVNNKKSYHTDSHDADFDDLNLPNLIDLDSRISTLPLRAYHSIYIDYFRDENYISVNPCINFARDGDDIDYTQSIDNIFDYLTLNYKSYEHDPYTTALPAPQRGEAVRFLNDAQLRSTDNVISVVGDNVGPLYINYSKQTAFGGNTVTAIGERPEVVVDLSAATIENFRFANATQKLLEKIARSGNRYYEYMKAIYGSDIEDAKIDRAIYLSGDKSPIQISEVLQTSASELTTDQPLGQMAGRGVSVGNDDSIQYYAPDHGFFIELCCALPRTNYQSGISPMFGRMVRLDYALNDYAQLGEQPVPLKELWYKAKDDEDNVTFGWQSRYYDMKYNRDRTSGSFKDSLSFWTWSRIFDDAPVAGKKFIEVKPDYRQFAVTDQSREHLYIHMWHDIQVNRSLPVFGVPSL